MSAFLALAGLLSAAEVFIVGEELSTLGEHLLALSRVDSPFHVLETRYGITSLSVATVVFFLSALRLRIAIRLLRGIPEIGGLGLVVLLLGIAGDALCFSRPLLYAVLVIDLGILTGFFRRGAA